MKHLLVILFIFIMLLGLSLGSCQRDETAGPGIKRDVSNVPEELTPNLISQEELQQLNPLEEVRLLTPQDDLIKTRLAFDPEEMTQGLSGVMPEDFGDDEGLLFFYLSDGTRNFWMPDTYFDLDIFYLNQNLQITEIVRSLPHHPGRSGNIPRAPSIWSRHVLEMKAGSPIAAELKVGDRLRWMSQLTLRQTESKILQQQ
jgi:uncharacterized protein